MRRLLIEALGVVVELDLSGVDEALADAVRSVWRDAETDAEEPVVVVPVAGLVSAGGSDAQVLSDLSQRVTLEAITARRGELWMLHAAGLALPDGRVIVLVGPSGRGKTTAARALGGLYGYVSDETVGIDRDGRVYPYRKPLSIIEGDAVKTQRAPSDLGLQPLPDGPLTLAGVVLLDREPDGPESPRVEPVDLGDVIDELVTQTSYLAAMDRPLQWIAETLGRTGGVRRWRYRDASDLAEAVPAVTDAVRAVTWAPAPIAAAPPGEGRYSRAAVLDAVHLEDPDRVVVLQADGENGMVRVLGGIAPALWEAADDVDAEVMVAATVGRFGAPEGVDAEELVSAAIGELVDAGVLAVGEEAVWRIADNVAWYGDESRVVVLNLDVPTTEVLALGGAAALIWTMLADGGLAERDVEGRTQALEEVREFLHSLGRARVIKTL